MVESSNGKTPEGEQTPETMPREDFQKWQSVMDKKLADETAAKNLALTALDVARAENKLMRENLPADTAKLVEVQRALKLQEGTLSEREARLAAVQTHFDALEVALEAKAAGVDIDVEELSKLPNKGEMALAVLRKKVSKPRPPAGTPVVVTKGQEATKTFFGESGSRALGEFLKEKHR